MKLYNYIIGSVATGFMSWLLSKELKAKNIKQTLTYENIKRISDAVDGLLNDQTSKRETNELKQTVEQLVRQNQTLEFQLNAQVASNKQLKKTTDEQISQLNKTIDSQS